MKPNNLENRKVKITSEYWGDSVVCTVKELMEQAEEYTRDRKGKGDEYEELGPVTVTIDESRKVAIDDRGRQIGELLDEEEAA